MIELLLITPALVDFVDAHDPTWYYAWCEREGTDEELVKYAEELGYAG